MPTFGRDLSLVQQQRWLSALTICNFSVRQRLHRCELLLYNWLHVQGFSSRSHIQCRFTSTTRCTWTALLNVRPVTAAFRSNATSAWRRSCGSSRRTSLCCWTRDRRWRWNVGTKTNLSNIATGKLRWAFLSRLFRPTWGLWLEGPLNILQAVIPQVSFGHAVVLNSLNALNSCLQGVVVPLG